MTPAPSKPQKFGVREFFKRFPSEEACLDHVMTVRYGMRHTCRKCGVIEATFHRITDRKAYACAHCGDHLYPCVGTIFQDSRTPLQIWFYAIFLFVSTRHGVSGRELSRQLGVTVKTGWRIAKQVRELIGRADDFSMLQGHVEVDEAFIGGRAYGAGKGNYRGNKTVVLGMKERGGRVRGVVVPDTKQLTLRYQVMGNVAEGTTVSTDEHKAYHLLEEEGYVHGRVNHMRKEWAKKDADTGVNHHTNSIENFWRIFKQSLASTHMHVSPQYMQSYVNEFAFRSTHRAKVQGMFDLLIAAI